MKKIEKEYLELYGEVPKDSSERLTYVLNKLNIKKDRDTIFERIDHIQNISWKEIKFIIYLVPKATPRPRCGKSTFVFYVSGAKDNREIFRKFINNIEQDMITTPCEFKCVNYFPVPSSMNKIEKLLSELGFIRPISKPDWDNLGKTYSDMIQEQLIYDDSLIIDGRSVKFYSFKPRIEVTIKYMEEHDSKYNKLKIERNLNKK